MSEAQHQQRRGGGLGLVALAALAVWALARGRAGGGGGDGESVSRGFTQIGLPSGTTFRPGQRIGADVLTSVDTRNADGEFILWDYRLNLQLFDAGGTRRAFTSRDYFGRGRDERVDNLGMTAPSVPGTYSILAVLQALASDVNGVPVPGSWFTLHAAEATGVVVESAEVTSVGFVSVVSVAQRRRHGLLRRG